MTGRSSRSCFIWRIFTTVKNGYLLKKRATLGYFHWEGGKCPRTILIRYTYTCLFFIYENLYHMCSLVVQCSRHLPLLTWRLSLSDQPQIGNSTSCQVSWYFYNICISLAFARRNKTIFFQEKLTFSLPVENFILFGFIIASFYTILKWIT